MGFSLSDLNPMSLISNAAQAVCHEVLPQNLQFVGDLVGLGIDYQTGNLLHGIEDLQKLLTDLPQNLASLGSNPGSHTSPGNSWLTRSAEPTPPPRYDSSSGSRATVVRGSPPTAAGTTPTTSASTPAATTQPAASPSAASRAPTSETPSPRPTAPPPTADQPSAAQVASTQPTATSSTTASSASAGADDPFFHQSDADLMNKVLSGQIPDSISKDPAKMQQLQARMNLISEMNQLISQMMAAIHDMHKQVIQNIRA